MTLLPLVLLACQPLAEVPEGCLGSWTERDATDQAVVLARGYQLAGGRGQALEDARLDLWDEPSPSRVHREWDEDLLLEERRDWDDDGETDEVSRFEYQDRNLVWSETVVGERVTEVTLFYDDEGQHVSSTSRVDGAVASVATWTWEEGRVERLDQVDGQGRFVAETDYVYVEPPPSLDREEHHRSLLGESLLISDFDDEGQLVEQRVVEGGVERVYLVQLWRSGRLEERRTSSLQFGYLTATRHRWAYTPRGLLSSYQLLLDDGGDGTWDHGLEQAWDWTCAASE